MEHDVVIVGGGVAGAACAHRLASAGLGVLVLERERRFKDRVRGDLVYPWGVVEARRLGLGDALESVARSLTYWRTHVAGVPTARPRDLGAEREDGAMAMAFYHPELQTALLAAAEKAGATVMRGAAVTGLTRTPDGPARVRVKARVAGNAFEVGARLVVAADGRVSAGRSWGGFEASADEERLMFAGVLLTGATPGYTRAIRDTAHVFFAPSTGSLAMVLPVDERHTRVYAGYHLATGRLDLSGREAFGTFLGLVEEAGVPGRWLAAAEVAGPLAQFSGADTWVQRPYSGGVALLGDAALASDPSFGCGMALAFRGGRLLAEAVLGAGSLEPGPLDAACLGYAAEVDAMGGALRRVTGWLREVYRVPGAEADAMRSRLWPLFARDPGRVPDVVSAGPEAPSDEAARRRFFGLE